MSIKLFFHKVFNWEYWPYQLVYIPVLFQWVVYSIFSRSFFFFNSCNPGLRNGGFFMESKKEIYDLMPKEFYPETRLIHRHWSVDKIHTAVGNLEFPLIAKPDIGLRGSAVRKINNIDELAAYHRKASFDYLIQRIIPFKNEIGIFYVRFPGDDKGSITGIVNKEWLTIKGNGTHTIKELVLKDPRFAFQLKAIEELYPDRMDEVPEREKEIILIPLGNHCRGAKFTDASNRITPALEATIDNFCKKISGFYFGRLDIMFNSWGELEKGENFMVVELNGAGSEPTHIYDPGHSIFFGWKELTRHIHYMYKISRVNNKDGVPFLNYKEGLSQYRQHLDLMKKFNAF